MGKITPGRLPRDTCIDTVYIFFFDQNIKGEVYIGINIPIFLIQLKINRKFQNFKSKDFKLL